MTGGSPGTLYPKLRPGPKGLSAERVREIQRERLCGAVIHAVATRGYDGVSVSEICCLAGISKHTLYELYPSKTACMQASYDAVLEEMFTAISSPPRPAADPMGMGRVCALIEAFQAQICSRPRGSVLTLMVCVEAAESDARGPRRLVDHLARLLRRCYEPAEAPPAFVLNGAATAIMSVTRSWIFAGREAQLGAVASELVSWIDGYRSPGAERLGEGRSRLLASAPQPSEEELDAELGEDAQQNLTTCCKRALGLMARAGRSDRDWARGTCIAYLELLRFVDRDPATVGLAFVDAPGLGPEADRVREAMIEGGVELYAGRAPKAHRPSEIVAHAVVGASWGLLHDMLEGRTERLSATAFSEQMSYIAVAPVLGAEAAVNSILER